MKFQLTFQFSEWTLNGDSVVEVPCGPLGNSNEKCYLNQNEYPIYKADLVRPRFLAVIEFHEQDY